MSTLYRQYRPTNFAEILGQNHIKTIIQNEILSKKIAQAYLFCGPRAVGKTTMARVLAKAVNCLNRKEDEYEPCNTCENCININAGRNMDIVEIDAASNTGVDNVRENIISSSRVSPATISKYKVFIIDEVHMLSLSAFNALLKILEEPPTYIIFVLCTTEIHKVPNTIISRCQRFDFKRISMIDMVKKLEIIIKAENIKISREILEAIARQADGHLRDAESLLGQILAVGGEEITAAEADLVIPKTNLNEILNLLDYINKKDAAKAIRLVNALMDDNLSLKNFMLDLIEICRKIMLNKINPSLAESLGLDFGETLELKINELSANLNLEQLIRFIERFNIVLREIKNNFIMQLPLELAIIELCNSNAMVEPIVSAPKINSTPVSSTPSAPLTSPQSSTSSPTVSSAPIINSSSTNVNLTKSLVEARWPEVLLEIKPLNHSLLFVLQSCQIKEASGKKICLVFKYKFHKDRLGDPKVREVINTVMRKVYGADLEIEALIDENLILGSNNKIAEESADPVIENTDSTQPNNNLLSDVLKTFGGEIVS